MRLLPSWASRSSTRRDGRSDRGRAAQRRQRFEIEALEGRLVLAGGITASYAVVQDWGTGFQGQVQIRNDSTTSLANWHLGFDLASSINSAWDASIVSHVGNHYELIGKDYDRDVPAGGSVTFGFTAASGSSKTATNLTVSGPTAAPTLTAGDAQVIEGNSGTADLAFDVTLSQASNSTVTVNYATSDGTALAGSDYQKQAGVLSFAPGEVKKTVHVVVNGDATVEPDETLSLTLSSPSGATLARGQATGTIVNDDATTSGSAQMSYRVTQDWGTGFQGEISIRNTGSTALSGWQVGFDLPRSITSIADAKILSHVGNHYVIGSAGWNDAIAAGSSVTVGFVASGGGTAATNFTLSSKTPPAANHAPVANADAVSTPAGQPVTVSALANDTDADNDTLVVTSTSKPGHGAATINKDGTITYTPDAGYAGADSFTYTISDGKGATATGTVSLKVVPQANHAPVAVDDAAGTIAGQATSIAVLSNDSDPDKDVLTVTSATKPGHGSATINKDGTITYTPDTGYTGPDSFNYTISDGKGGTATGTINLTVTAAPVPNPGAWSTSYYAPYVDMTLWPTPDMVALSKASGATYLTLAFITADSQNKPSWGGYDSYEVNGGGDFDAGVKSQIAAFRAAGGDVQVSFGGANGRELAQAITDVTALKAAYRSVIDAYGLTHLDFDIEGSAASSPERTSIDRRNQALAALQREAAAAGRELTISYTLPALPTGLTADGLSVLRSAKAAGVRVEGVNIMAMDYGDSAAPNPKGHMGDYAIQAATSLFDQLGTLYGSSLSDAQKWRMIGVTPMIGLNDVMSETFTQQDARQLEAWAASHQIGRLSMWSLNRDLQNRAGAISYVDTNSSSIVQTPYEFSSIFKGFQN